MSQAVLIENKPGPRDPTTMYTVPASNVGVMGQLLVVNQGNSEVNAGNIVADYGRDTDYVTIALGQTTGSGIASYISFETVMPPNHMAQWQEICIATGETIIVESKKGQCSFVFTGFCYNPS